MPCFDDTFLKRAVMVASQFHLFNVLNKCHSGNSQLEAASQATFDGTKRNLWFRVSLMCKYNHICVFCFEDK